ncbi:MAG: hypothetical protein QOH53_1016, partial [Ilumatobacteraceae bacterium]
MVRWDGNGLTISPRTKGENHVKSKQPGHRISQVLVVLAATSIIAAAC